MTLADFAREIGISPATARQWKKRGKVVESEGEYLLSDDLSYPEFKEARKSKRDSVTRVAVTVERDSVTPESVTGRDKSVTELFEQLYALRTALIESNNYILELQERVGRLETRLGMAGARSAINRAADWGA